MAPGCSIRLSTAPSDSARVNSSVRGDDLAGCRLATLHGEADHAAVVVHLLGCRGVARVIGELWVQHPLDRRMVQQQVDDGTRVLAVAIHADAERLGAPQHEVAVERRRNGARCVLGEPQAIGELVVVEGDEASDDVTVPAEVLGGRVEDDVGAECDRLLEIRRGEGVVDDDDARRARGRSLRSPRCRSR